MRSPGATAPLRISSRRIWSRTVSVRLGRRRRGEVVPDPLLALLACVNEAPPSLCSELAI
jgi:hypothetical protein